MAIDIRATVTCSLGTLISGSISDDYLQGTGLIKTRGSVEISGTITPAIGTVVTFSYVKGGVTRSIPRKLRVLSSFADPFRRTTKVELGCKLTYLSDLKDPINWDAFDDPENSGYTAEDDRIVTLPIYARSVMAECLSKLGITSSSLPLSNAFSVAEFDFSSGYVQVLSDLLVSECYFGYLDTSEVLQIRSLNASGGTGPVFTSADIVDLGPIGVGQLPGEAVTVSYSTLKLKNPEEQNAEEEALTNWERDEFIGAPTTVQIANPFYDNNPFPTPQVEFFTFTYTPSSVTITEYDDYDRVVTRTTTETSILAEAAPSYIRYVIKRGGGGGSGAGSTRVQTITTERTEYAFTGSSSLLTAAGESTEKLSEIRAKITEVEEPEIKLQAATSLFEEAASRTVWTIGGTGGASSSGPNVPVNLDFTPNTISSKTVVLYKSEYVGGRQITLTTTHRFGARGYTQADQQQTASFYSTLADANLVFAGNSANLVYLGAERQTVTGRQYGLEQRPSSADRTNDSLNAAKDDPNADPNNGWRVDSISELELAVGSATAQRRIEFSMPYAPDDRFSGPSGGPFYSFPSDAPQKAKNYGVAQNRLLLGNRNGMNLQLSPERLPSAPFDPLYVQASGLTAIYRANGTSWAFDSNGIVASIDALFWAAVSGTGTFWFPVAPGVTTLPTEPPIVDGQMNANNVVLPYNQTVVYDSRIRLIPAVTKFDYSLTLLTVVPPTVIKLVPDARRILPIHIPAAGPITTAALIPAIRTGYAAHPSAIAIQVARFAPAVRTGTSVAVPATTVAVLTYDAVVPRLSTSVAIPSTAITVARFAPTLATGVSVAVPAAAVTVAAQAPSLPPPFSIAIYTGTGATQSITGVGFEPGLILFARRATGAGGRLVFDYARGTTKYWVASTSTGETTDANSLTAFGSDGFTIGTDAIINTNTSTNVAWCWAKGTAGASNTDGTITTTAYSNNSAGYSIFTYTGNATNSSTVGHGLGATPELVIIKNRSVASGNDIYVGGSFLSTNEYMNLNSTTVKGTDTAAFQSYSSTTVGIGTRANVNGSGNSMIGYAFKSVTGTCKIGTYTGTGASNQTITVGFTPRFLLIKTTAGSVGNWVLFDSVRGVTKQLTIAAATETTVDKITFNSDSFTVKASQDVNTSSVSYVYMAYR